MICPRHTNRGYAGKISELWDYVADLRVNNLQRVNLEALEASERASVNAMIADFSDELTGDRL